MSDTYRIVSRGPVNRGIIVHDVLRNGVPWLITLTYPEAYQQVLAVIGDEDRYEEEAGGKVYLSVRGGEVKGSEERARRQREEREIRNDY